ncbi:hypothetical protein TNCV_657721 [Trichonephila clavipes]|uniref:Uncharacterized protein n=1 Tax=Trichonephila clavipes TaxID=2585209 RepID=A0A8X6VLC5_TRICX|nr:hypothetical protein TNCV_657721 [Trichonephila clavipes]
MQRQLSRFRRLKKQQHGAMSERVLKDMMVKFEKAEQLDVLPGTRTHDMPDMIRYPDHWATAAPFFLEENEKESTLPS